MTAVALITGASAGLGEEFARQLAGKGLRLVVVARRRERLDALVADLDDARALALDLSAPDSCQRLMADLAAAGERVELLVNNAGFGLAGRFANLDAAQQRMMIDLNCGLLTELARAVVPGMIERRSGRILNVASTAAFQPGPGMAVYFATKAFVLSFSEALHEELRPHDIKVTALCPGPTATEFGKVAGFGGNGVFDRLSADAPSVVRLGLKALQRNRAVAIPGLMNKASAQGHRLLPRMLVRKAAGLIKL
jgi:hypothetical protein